MLVLLANLESHPESVADQSLERGQGGRLTRPRSAPKISDRTVRVIAFRPSTDAETCCAFRPDGNTFRRVAGAMLPGRANFELIGYCC